MVFEFEFNLYLHRMMFVNNNFYEILIGIMRSVLKPVTYAYKIDAFDIDKRLKKYVRRGFFINTYSPEKSN